MTLDRTALALAALLPLTACGGSFCARSAALAEDCNGNYIAQDEATCDEAMSSCTSDDEKQMSRYLDCLEDSGVCEATQDDNTAWESAFACLGEVADISDECAALAF